MCDWDARELLSDWQARTRLDLARLGSSGAIRTDEEGRKALFDLTGPAVHASFTVWSTGILELALAAPSARDREGVPVVLTEQRFGRSAAQAVLDGWLIRLRHAAASAMADATQATDTPAAGIASTAVPQLRD